MNAIPFAVSLILISIAAQQDVPQQQQPDPAQQQKIAEAREQYEAGRQAAIRVDKLAGNIHSEDDARVFVDAVAQRLTSDQLQMWTTLGIRHRVAHAEFEAVSNPSRLIPEQRIVDLWNQYVRELDAPEETLVTLAEVHNLRDAMSTSNRYIWNKDGFPQSLWTVPSIYALGADGKVANGCRAVEALKIFHDMSRFQNLQAARERVQKGILASDLMKQRAQDPKPKPQSVQSHLAISKSANPLLTAEYRYVQAHGERDYQRLLERLFAQLFPAD